MPNYTANYNLEKPIAETENYDVNVFNLNADKIDTELKNLDNKINGIEIPVTSVNEKTGAVTLNATDVGAETPAGAQAKADAAAAAAIAAHEEDPDPHEQYALDVDLAALQDEINDHKDENATEAKKGHVELATTTEATTGTDTERAVTAAGVKAHMDNRVKTFSVTLDTTWSGSSAPFSKTVTVSGILATDTPIVDVVMSGTYATDQDRQKAWSKIYRIVTANNQITLYASVKPTVSLPIQLKVVR